MKEEITEIITWIKRRQEMLSPPALILQAAVGMLQDSVDKNERAEYTVKLKQNWDCWYASINGVDIEFSQDDEKDLVKDNALSYLNNAAIVMGLSQITMEQVIFVEA